MFKAGHLAQRLTYLEVYYFQLCNLSTVLCLMLLSEGLDSYFSISYQENNKSHHKTWLQYTNQEQSALCLQ